MVQVCGGETSTVSASKFIVSQNDRGPWCGRPLTEQNSEHSLECRMNGMEEDELKLESS